MTDRQSCEKIQINAVPRKSYVFYRKYFFSLDHEEIPRTEGENTNEDLESLRSAVANLEHNLNNCRQEIHDKEDRIKHLVRFGCVVTV